jgi:polysaccharide export outer membrane protein
MCAVIQKFGVNFSIPFWSLLWSLLKGGILLTITTSCAPPVYLPDLLVDAKPRHQEVPLTPPKSLTTFQKSIADNEQNYLLGAGDDITVEIWGYTELSGKHLIGPDGRITLPLAGPLRLAGLAREQAAQLIKTTLSQYYTELSVAVRVDRYASNRILVLGRVSRPGEVQFGMTHPTLLEAISLAGGLTEASGLPGQAQSLPSSYCAVFRGRDQIVWIGLEPLLTGKDLALNLKLQRNDVVYIPDIEERLVYVLGEVRNPGAFRLTPQMSFLDLVAKAGGPTRDAAAGRINIIRPQEGTNKTIALKELMSPNQRLNFALQEGDIIYVPTNAIAKINYALQFLNPFTTILGIYANITSIQADTQQRKLDKEEAELQTERAAIEAEKARNSGLE